MHIRIWHATSSHQQPGKIEQLCESYLDHEDRVRADRFRQPTSRNQHVIGRGMARRLIGQQTGIDPSEIRFGFENHGKPFVDHPPIAQQPFNVAHTGGLVLCGLTDQDTMARSTIQLGVDVEGIDRRTDPAIAERFFSKPEVRYLNTHRSEAAKRVAFLKIWTLKESFIKAIGTGMATPLADFAFDEIDSQRPVIRMLSEKLDQGQCWQFTTFEPRPGYLAAAAICCGTRTPEPTVELLDFDEVAG